jgi:hypothetical protein
LHKTNKRGGRRVPDYRAESDRPLRLLQLLYIESVGVKPQHHGNRLGMFLMFELMRRYVEDGTYTFILPHPDDDIGVPAAQLPQHYRTHAFRKLGASYFVFYGEPGDRDHFNFNFNDDELEGEGEHWDDYSEDDEY